MRSKLALALAAAALLGACSQSPTASSPRQSAVPRYDDGSTPGSGGATGTEGGNTMGSGNTATSGPNTLGSGH